MSECDSACRGKVRYLSRREAKAAAKACARGKLKGLHPYLCDFCGLYHLGHRPGEATYRRRSAWGGTS